MEEILDIYSREGKHLGTRTREECHSKEPGFYHKPVWIWIVNSRNEILVQRRASIKKSFPNYWDMPSAGHVAAGESSIKGAIRETAEELGVITNEEKTELLKKIKNGDNEAREKFIQGNLRLVLSVIQRFTRTWRKHGRLISNRL